MNIIPIVFAFDNNMAMPAAVSICSLFQNALSDTQYDVFILYPSSQNLDRQTILSVAKLFPQHKVTFIPVDDAFEGSFEIRGINNLTYYRLRIPELIPQYDKVYYSDVDVIFQADLSEMYITTDLNGKYLGGVNSCAHLDKDLNAYYQRFGLPSDSIIYAGNILMNSKLMREAGFVETCMGMTKNKYRFQDLDIINIVCKDKIAYLPPCHCMTTYLHDYALNQRDVLLKIWTEDEIEFAQKKGVIHYNGQKPWKGYCPNFDIWWEYYRKSPIFDPKFYFDFFYGKLDELDQLTLWKRIKVLARYFTVGKK